MCLLIPRIAFLLCTVWLILTIGFYCVYRLPGDPARMILGHQASEETVQAFRIHAGLDQPLWRQYARSVNRSMRLDFGDSLLYRRRVVDLIQERGFTTVKL